jgi:hypothetical protein
MNRTFFFQFEFLTGSIPDIHHLLPIDMKTAVVSFSLLLLHAKGDETHRTELGEQQLRLAVSSC